MQEMSVVNDLLVVRMTIRAIKFLNRRYTDYPARKGVFDFLEYLENFVQYPQEDDLQSKVVQTLGDTLEASIENGTDDFEIRYLNKTDGHIGCCRIITYIYQNVYLQNTLKSKLQVLLDPLHMNDTEVSRVLDIAYWSIRSTIAGCVSTKKATRKNIKSAIHSCMQQISGPNPFSVLPCPFRVLYESIQKTYLSAVLIQRTWRRSIADPSMALCRKRLQRDCL
jgi:hypothetical protein